MKMIWKRALPLGLLGTGSLWYGGCVAQLIHHVNQRKAQTMAVLQTPSSESVPLSPEQAELCRIRSPLMNRFMEFYQPLKGMDHLDLSDVLAEDLSFQDHGVSCQGWWAVNRIRPQNGGWFSRSFDTRLIHLAHDVGGTQGVELTVRHMFVFRWSKTYFTLWNKIVLDLEGPAGEEKIVGIQEHWFGVPLSKSPFQSSFRRFNGLISALIGCGVDRFLYIKYLLSWDAR